MSGAFTTVMQWDSYPSMSYNGRQFGMKSHSFELIRQLPREVECDLEIAIGGVSAPRGELSQQGWRLVNSLDVTRDPWSYQEYLQRSRGEFSIAKHGYVVTRSGWFSERTACYLASGRPAVVQDTGFSRHIPQGMGVFAFDDAESAVVALNEATTNYEKHCRAAREIAEAYFDSDTILGSLIDESMSAKT
jgi:hypothetical protein